MPNTKQKSNTLPNIALNKLIVDSCCVSCDSCGCQSSCCRFNLSSVNRNEPKRHCHHEKDTSLGSWVQRDFWYCSFLSDCVSFVFFGSFSETHTSSSMTNSQTHTQLGREESVRLLPLSLLSLTAPSSSPILLLVVWARGRWLEFWVCVWKHRESAGSAAPVNFPQGLRSKCGWRGFRARNLRHANTHTRTQYHCSEARELNDCLYNGHASILFVQ